MTPEEEMASETRTAWNFFDTFSYSELIHLLTLAGVVHAKTRKLLLAQCLIVWFHGNVPNFVELDRLSH